MNVGFFISVIGLPLFFLLLLLYTLKDELKSKAKS